MKRHFGRLSRYYTISLVVVSLPRFDVIFGRPGKLQCCVVIIRMFLECSAL